MNCTVADEKSYISPGFLPIAAHNLMHAAFLFAIWKARRTFGPGATCARLDLQVELTEGATFEADFINPNRGSRRELSRFSVLIHRSGQ